MMGVLLLAAGLMISFASAWATPRNFPANAQRGVLTATVYPQILIDGQTRVLSPGAKIFGQQNTIVMHSTLVNSAVIVNYTIDNQGYVDRVWILTNEELAASQ
jgi:hypothetical protein